MRNTPSRARFSSGPPNKRSKGKGGRGRGNAGRGGGAAKAAVVEKIAKRVETKQSTTNSSSINSNTASLTKITRRRHPLANVNISKLDELILPEESLQEVMKLLSDLKVKVVESVTRKGGGSKEETDEYDSDTQAETTQADNTLLEDEDAESYASDMEEETEGFYSEQQSRQLAGTAYAEYEDDLEEEDELLLQGGTYASQIPGDVDSTVWEGQENDEEDDEDKQKSKGEFTFTIDQLQTDPVFVHLTKRLSFSEATALRACQAIEDMTSNDTQLSDNNTSNQESQRRREGERMAFAMDWLCLHLEEDELQAGFKTNPNMASPIILMGTGRTKPIPHPSISVAPKITTDRDWKKSILVQDRILGFQQLGFQHSETYDVFKEYDLDRLEQESSSPKKAIDDDDALRHLLASLESKILEEDGLGNEALKQQQHTQADIDFAAEERESEEQALQAIYEDHFRVVKQPNTSSSSSLYRYILEVTLVEPLKEPARSEDCSLHVFVRPGYPAFETPLFLFSNPSLPPTLLRRVNVELIRHAHQNLGAPAVFDAVNYLSSELAALQLDFMKEQRSKELDAQQLRLRKEAGHKIDEEAEYDSEAKLGRRQRAKLKAAAKAFDQPEIAKKAEEERQQRQTARIERVKDEDKNIRQSMASRAIEQREKERQQEEMDAIYRSALSASLNKGHSTEAAREIATKAKSAYLKLHGLEDPDAPVESTRDAHLSEDAKGKEKSSLGLDIEEDIVDGQSKEETRKAPYSTPKTVAFMERLREMYAAAAKEKVDGKAGDTQTSTKGRNKKREEDLGGYHLNPPKRMAEGEEIDGESQRFPRPVAVPVGELKRVMEDVIKIQQEQPWLVSSEARAPETATMSGQDDRNSLSQKCKDISRKLKQENERKYKAVEDWRKNQASGGNVQMDNNKKGFSPQRFNKMLSQRERLPAYAMRDHIISTIAANQVTVVAGDTGCGKVC